MSIDLNVLKTELDTDPQVLGLAAMTDGVAATKLNEVGASSETIEPEFITAVQAQSAIAAADFSALSATEQRMWIAILSLGRIPIRNTNIRAQVAGIWSGTASATALAALQDRSASRAEILFGEDEVVGMMHVHKARLL